MDKIQSETKADGWTLDNTVVLALGMGVGEALVEFLKKYHADEAIVGSRQLGPFKKAMMTLIGKGSISDYLVHHAPTTVVVVRDDH